MLLSHPKEGDINEKSLFEHLNKVGELSKKYVLELKLHLHIINKKKLSDLAYLLGISHDFGKATSYFQAHILNRFNGKESNHALISGIFCYYLIKNIFNCDLLAIISYMIIKRHHSNLETIEELKSSEYNILQKQLNDIKNNQLKELTEIYKELLKSYNIDFVNLLNKIEINNFIDLSCDFEEIIDEVVDENKIELFLLTNLLFSVLIDSDKKDAARLNLDYFEGDDKFKPVDIIKYIEYKRKLEPEKLSLTIPINKFRNEFLKEILINEEINPRNHFYTLSAPTGIGKTFGAFGFANKLKKQLGNVKIIYCLPYTSIIDQNFDELEKLLIFKYSNNYHEKPNKYLLRHHYLTPKIIINRNDNNKEDKSFKDYMDDKLLVESWESANIVTTFIQLFYSIIGYKNTFLKKFHNIINSIIILDEIQVLEPKYYLLIKNIFNVLGKRFNTYFLLLTATQPKILDEDEVINLINEDKYFKNDIFNRITLSINLKTQSLTEFYKNFINKINQEKFENCLIVLNTKKSVVAFYKKLYKKYHKDYKLYCLTTYLTPNDRLLKISEIKNLLRKKEKLIVISTQLIEAGVDLSFKYVFRDFGLLDSIIQVAGRCNRNGEYFQEKGKMFLVRLKEDTKSNLFYKYIYKESIFEQWIFETFNDRTEFESKDFYQLCNIYFSKFDFKSLSKQLLDSIKKLNYTMYNTPVKDFTLIEDFYNQETVVICQSEEIEKYINSVNYYYKKLKVKDISKKDKQEALLEIMKIKNKIIPFQINIFETDLENYIETNLIKRKKEDNNVYISYITYNDQKKYLYDKNIGFLIEPKKDPPKVINI